MTYYDVNKQAGLENIILENDYDDLALFINEYRYIYSLQSILLNIRRQRKRGLFISRGHRGHEQKYHDRDRFGQHFASS